MTSQAPPCKFFLTVGILIQFLFFQTILAQDRQEVIDNCCCKADDNLTCFSKEQHRMVKPVEVLFQCPDALLKWDADFAALRHIYPACNEFQQLAAKGPAIKAEFRNLKAKVSQLSKSSFELLQDYVNQAAACADAIKLAENYDLWTKGSIIKVYYKQAAVTLATADSLLNYKLLLSIEQTIDRMKDVTPCYLSSPIFH